MTSIEWEPWARRASIALSRARVTGWPSSSSMMAPSSSTPLAGPRPGGSGRRAPPQDMEGRAGRKGNVHLVGRLGRKVLAPDAQEATRHPPRLANLVRDLAGQVDGDREPDVHRDAGVDDGRI